MERRTSCILPGVPSRLLLGCALRFLHAMRVGQGQRRAEGVVVHVVYCRLLPEQERLDELRAVQKRDVLAHDGGLLMPGVLERQLRQQNGLDVVRRLRERLLPSGDRNGHV